MKPFKLLQITDPHLGGVTGSTLLGMDTDQSFLDVLEDLCANEKPDLIMATGDISSDGSVSSYVRFLKTVDDFFPNVPLAWLPGNHDDSRNMTAAAGHPIELAYTAGDWHFVLLDSHVPGQPGGSLSLGEIQRLDAELAQHVDKPTIVFLHHQPLRVGSDWIDQYAVDNADILFDVLDKYPQVKVLSWGHIHQEFVSKHKGITLIATPSTCVQFEPNNHTFKVSELMPGYRSYDLFPDGHFTTKVKRVAQKKYSIDFASKGY